MTDNLYQVSVYKNNHIIFDSLIKSNNQKLVLWYLYRLHYDSNTGDEYENFMFLKIKYLLDSNPSTIAVCHSEMIIRYKSLFSVCLFMTANDLLSLQQIWDWTIEFNTIYKENRIVITQRLIFDINTRSFENIKDEFKLETISRNMKQSTLNKIKKNNKLTNILEFNNKLNNDIKILNQYSTYKPKTPPSTSISDILAKYSNTVTSNRPSMLTLPPKPRPKIILNPIGRPKTAKPRARPTILTSRDYIRNYNKKQFTQTKTRPLTPPSPTTPDKKNKK